MKNRTTVHFLCKKSRKRLRILAFLTIFVPKKRNRVDNIGFLNNTERVSLFYSLAVVTMAVLLAAFIHDSSVMELMDMDCWALFN